MGSDFGFSIPGSSIDGIVAEFEKKASAAQGRDSGIYVSKDAFVSTASLNRADISTDWPTTDTYVAAGGVTDLWGYSPTLTPSDVNGSSFALLIQAVANAGVITFSVDHMRLTVHYPDPPSPEVKTTNVSVLLGTERYGR